ncbi:hypothetical protein JK2ML_1928 [Mycobacterium leprae Kyoto-2]|uniref:Uncharacterized protein n=3 Tax=Mycobacterium leprae TaxID=1769 RepID=Q9CBI3_MYCLE|nr:hypothetical protein DIJ64_10600 [Mycobacterium leprae]OAR20154.1 hypothetical protein A8144_11890 [Mycobacterium leprae 3125609]OAX70505.1 hypothetical protein A3216_11525 [Mycobacterium leprae 7935681]CAR72025.1 hypothetical protein MLBr01928 [Mycobacterium leprae Br4923]BBC17465.1 hypothetical protein JK2ML_1928 [Mycobacterium leprae Kyoto-2]
MADDLFEHSKQVGRLAGLGYVLILAGMIKCAPRHAFMWVKSHQAI